MSRCQRVLLRHGNAVEIPLLPLKLILMLALLMAQTIIVFNLTAAVVGVVVASSTVPFNCVQNYVFWIFDGYGWMGGVGVGVLIFMLTRVCF